MYNKNISPSGLKLIPKLKREHVALNSYSRMRVDLAAQVCTTVYLLVHESSSLAWTGPNQHLLAPQTHNPLSTLKVIDNPIPKLVFLESARITKPPSTEFQQ